MARAAGIPDEDIRRTFAPRVDFEVWPENSRALQVFDAVAPTQWNVAAGMGGVVRVGLRYEVLPFVMDLQQVPAGERPEVFWALRVMEDEVLQHQNRGPAS